MVEIATKGFYWQVDGPWGSQVSKQTFLQALFLSQSRLLVVVSVCPQAPSIVYIACDLVWPWWREPLSLARECPFMTSHGWLKRPCFFRAWENVLPRTVVLSPGGIKIKWNPVPGSTFDRSSVQWISFWQQTECGDASLMAVVTSHPNNALFRGRFGKNIVTSIRWLNSWN